MDKNTLLTSGKYAISILERRSIFKDGYDPNDYTFYSEIFTEDEAKECIKIYKADKQRKYRMFNKLLEWYFAAREIGAYQESKIVFFTLTWTNEDLEKTSKETRRRYIQRFLKENSIAYIANIDYGEENGREHYHAMALINEDIDIKKWKRIDWIKVVPKKTKDLKKITKYILKLTNHAYKDSTRREKAIYSKNNDLLEYYLQSNYEEYLQFKKLVSFNLT